MSERVSGLVKRRVSDSSAFATKGKHLAVPGAFDHRSASVGHASGLPALPSKDTLVKGQKTPTKNGNGTPNTRTPTRSPAISPALKAAKAPPTNGSMPMLV